MSDARFAKGSLRPLAASAFGHQALRPRADGREGLTALYRRFRFTACRPTLGAMTELARCGDSRGPLSARAFRPLVFVMGVGQVSESPSRDIPLNREALVA